MTPDATFLHHSRPPPHITRVCVADGTLLHVSSIGRLSTSSFSVHAVSHVPRLLMSLMSVSQITDFDCHVIFDRTSCRVQDRSVTVIGVGRRYSGVYCWSPFIYHLPLDRLIYVMLLFCLTISGIIVSATCAPLACRLLPVMVS